MLKEVSMVMSENTCALVDLFDKAVAERARPNTVTVTIAPLKYDY